MFASPFKTTVTTPAASKDMTVLATVLAELGLTGTDASRDALLAALIKQASAAIVAYCRRELASETVRDDFRTETERRCIEALILDRTPVTALGTVVENGVTLGGADTELDPATGFLYRLDGQDCRIAWAHAKITVAYTGGFVMLTTLPNDLERACIDLVKHRWFARARDPLVKSVSVDGVATEGYWVGGVGEGAGLPPDVEALIAPYRRIVV